MRGPSIKIVKIKHLRAVGTGPRGRRTSATSESGVRVLFVANGDINYTEILDYTCRPAVRQSGCAEKETVRGRVYSKRKTAISFFTSAALSRRFRSGI